MSIKTVYWERGMGRRIDTEVIINNKRYKLTGFENEEYLQRIAGFLNSKISEMKQLDIYKGLDSDMKNIFLEINLADEYFKMKNKYEESEADSESKSNEIYSMKHEIMSLQSKLEIAEKEIEKQKALNIEEQKKNVKLETELSSERKIRKPRVVQKTEDDE